MNRYTALHIDTFTLDGTSYLARWQNLEAGHEISVVDGRGGSDRYANFIFGKRSSGFDFTINLNDAATTTVISSAVHVTGWTAGAMNLLDDWKDFTIAYNSPTGDGSGGRSKDEYANYLGGCTFEISGSFLIAGTSTTIAAIDAILSDTLANQEMTMTIATGAVSMSATTILKTARWSTAAGDFQRLSLAFSCKGAPSAVTAGLIGNILTGTGTSSLFSLAVASAGGKEYEMAEACVSEMSINVAEGQVQRASGKLQACAKPTFAAP